MDGSTPAPRSSASSAATFATTPARPSHRFSCLALNTEAGGSPGGFDLRSAASLSTSATSRRAALRAPMAGLATTGAPDPPATTPAAVAAPAAAGAAVGADPVVAVGLAGGAPDVDVERGVATPPPAPRPTRLDAPLPLALLPPLDAAVAAGAGAGVGGTQGGEETDSLRVETGAGAGEKTGGGGGCTTPAAPGECTKGGAACEYPCPPCPCLCPCPCPCPACDRWYPPPPPPPPPRMSAGWG